MQKRKSRAYYQYMLDLADQKVGYYSTDDISLIAYDLLDDGDEEEALAACEKGLDQHPDDEFVLIVKAKVLGRMGRYDESERLLKGNPDEQSPFGISIRFAIDLHRSGERAALDALMADVRSQKLLPQEAIDILDERFDQILNAEKGIFLMNLSEYIEQSLDSLDSEDPQPAETLGRLGAMLMDCNCHEYAIHVLERALDIDAYDVYSWQDLARCQFNEKSYKACEQSCEMGLAIDPHNPFFNYALGAIRYGQRRFDECIAYLETVRQYFEGKIRHEEMHLDQNELNTQRDSTYELLGNAYQATERYEEAIDCYTHLIQHLPYFAEGYFRLSMLYAGIRDFEHALWAVSYALKLEPDNEEYAKYKDELTK